MEPHGRRRAAQFARSPVQTLRSVLGGSARTKAILLLAGILALNTADVGTIGAVAPALEGEFGISHTQLSLFATVSAAVGAMVVPVAGVFADRANRVHLLIIAVALWSLIMAIGGLATGYWWLLFSRLALGATVAASGPVIASLIGDLFRPGERARVFGWVLSGELVGAGAGLLIGGGLGLVFSWRIPFFLLAIWSAGMAWALWRSLPEPARGGDNWLQPGAEDFEPHQQAAAHDADTGRAAEAGNDNEAEAVIAGQDIAPADDRVLRRDPNGLSLWAAAIYLLRIPTIRNLIVASAVGYFFFAGLRTFAVIYVIRRFQVSIGLVIGLAVLIGLFGLVGTIGGGRVADRLLRQGHSTARIVVPASGYVGSALVFAPALLLTNVWQALPLLAAAAALLGAANAPLDAARLDIVPGRLWGRAESVRTVLRLIAEAMAPVTFGLLADHLGTGQGNAIGIRNAFLVMLIPLAANGIIVMVARRSYPVDVATAIASDAATMPKRRSDR